MSELDYLRDERKRNRKLISQVKVGSWVLTESGNTKFSYIKRQLFRIDGFISSLDFIHHYKSDEIYTNFRLPPEWATKPFHNSLAIVEIVPEELVERYVKLYSMWESNKFNLELSE